MELYPWVVLPRRDWPTVVRQETGGPSALCRRLDRHAVPPSAPNGHRPVTRHLAKRSRDPCRRDDHTTRARDIGLRDTTDPHMVSVTPGTRMPGAMIAPRSPAIQMEGWDPSYPKSNAKEIL